MFTSFVVGLGLALQRRTNQAHFLLLTNTTMDDHAGKNTFNYRHHRHSQLSTQLRFGINEVVDRYLRGFCIVFSATQRIHVFENQTLHEWTTGPGHKCDKGELSHQCPPTTARWDTCQIFGWQQAALSVLPRSVLPQPFYLFPFI